MPYCKIRSISPTSGRLRVVGLGVGYLEFLDRFVQSLDEGAIAIANPGPIPSRNEVKPARIGFFAWHSDIFGANYLNTIVA